MNGHATLYTSTLQELLIKELTLRDEFSSECVGLTWLVVIVIVASVIVVATCRRRLLDAAVGELVARLQVLEVAVQLVYSSSEVHSHTLYMRADSVIDVHLHVNRHSCTCTASSIYMYSVIDLYMYVQHVKNLIAV